MEPDLPVVIVGAGPAGLVTAIGLAQQGVRSLVIERHPSTSIFPRATGVSLRSMEIFRAFGIDAQVRAAGRPVKPVGATVRRLDDRSPVESPLGFPDETASAAVSPSLAAVCPQDVLEPVLVERYRSFDLGDIRFSTELVTFDQDASGVTVVVRDRSTGATETIRCRYLVGADGHRSMVRQTLGIPMEGPDDLGQFMSILFRADLADVLGDPVYGLYMLQPNGPGGPPTVVVPTGTDDRFVLGIPLPPGMGPGAMAGAFTPERCLELVRAAAGRPDLDVEILATNAFAFSAQVAARTQAGRVVLIGDAAHRMTPRGGRGMNTAIADGFDLAWKLAWVARGLADESLVESYAVERGPIGRRNVALSMVPEGAGSADGLAEDLGTVYDSAWIVGDGTPPPVVDAGFVPDARPGARAPHVWLSAGDGRISTLDLFGHGFVLLTAATGGEWGDAAARLVEDGLDLPLEVRVVGTESGDDLDGFRAAYGIDDDGAVVVRPDGIVAWRCRTAPADRPVALRKALDVALGQPVAGPATATVRSAAA